jgi:hypothetical protein
VIFPSTVLEQMAGSAGHDVVGVRAKSQSFGRLVLGPVVNYCTAIPAMPFPR